MIATTNQQDSVNIATSDINDRNLISKNVWSISEEDLVRKRENEDYTYSNKLNKTCMNVVCGSSIFT